MSSLSVAADIPADKDLLGKVISDLQTSVEVGKSAITGTLKYVDDYTGFSGDVSEQTGNYIALHATSEIADSITAEYNGRTVTLDSDGIVITRVVDKTKPLKITAINGDASYTRTFDLSGLTLEEDV